jgi:hypothetical protein
LAVGMLLVSNKNIYFNTNSTSIKIAMEEISDMISYEDWIWIQIKDLDVRPQILRWFDGWFAYNIITNLIKIIDKNKI